MADNPLHIDDGLTEAERHYLATGGDVTDALVAENKDLPAAPPQEPTAATPEQPEAPAVIAQPEAEDEDHEEPAQAGKKPRRVAYAKYEAEQQARAQLERQVQEQAVKNARIEERLALLQQALVAPEQPAAAEEKPDPEKDIFGYARYLERQLNSVAEKVNTYEQQITTGQAELEAERRYFSALDQGAAKDPNFVQAYSYLLSTRTMELMAQRFPNANVEQLGDAIRERQVPADIADMVRQEERDLYRSAFEANRDPANDIVRYARLRGFLPSAAPAANGAAAQANGAANGAANGRAAPANGLTRSAAPAAARPAATNGAAPTAADVVESIKRGQSAAMSLSNVAGGTGIELTPQVLAEMSEEDFAAVVEDLQRRGDKTKLMQLFGS